MKILELFTKEQCKKIIEDIELNKEYLGISTEHGVERISSYEIDCKHLSKHVTNMINNVIDKKIRPITGGEVGMVFGVKYTLDTKPDMEYHYDVNNYSCVIQLNDDYEGGGTYFPFMGHKIIDDGIGRGVLFKADKINSYHKANPITKGKRYVLVIRMEKNNQWVILFKAYFFNFLDYVIRKLKLTKNPT